MAKMVGLLHRPSLADIFTPQKQSRFRADAPDGLFHQHATDGAAFYGKNPEHFSPPLAADSSLKYNSEFYLHIYLVVFIMTYC